MTNTIYNLLFGRDSLLSGLFAIAVVALIALGCTCGKNFDLANIAKNANVASTSDSNDTDDESAELPDDRLLKALVKETTADFAQAVSTEDFSKIYEKSSTDFQTTYTEQEMKDTFKPFIQKKKQVLPILAKAVGTDPEYSPVPSIRTESGLSILVTEGKFATKPIPLTFEYEYVKRGGQWKLLKLVIKLV